MAKLSRRAQEAEARKAADPLAQALGREDIDYESDDLPTAPRLTVIGVTPEPRGAEIARVDGSKRERIGRLWEFLRGTTGVHTFESFLEAKTVRFEFEGYLYEVREVRVTEDE